MIKANNFFPSNQHPGSHLTVWKRSVRNWTLNVNHVWENWSMIENGLKARKVRWLITMMQHWIICASGGKNLKKISISFALLVSPHSSKQCPYYTSSCSAYLQHWQWKCAASDSRNRFNYLSLSNSLPTSKVNELQTSETKRVFLRHSSHILLCDN